MSTMPTSMATYTRKSRSMSASVTRMRAITVAQESR